MKKPTRKTFGARWKNAQKLNLTTRQRLRHIRTTHAAQLLKLYTELHKAEEETTEYEIRDDEAPAATEEVIQSLFNWRMVIADDIFHALEPATAAEVPDCIPELKRDLFRLMIQRDAVARTEEEDDEDAESQGKRYTEIGGYLQIVWESMDDEDTEQIHKECAAGDGLALARWIESHWHRWNPEEETPLGRFMKTHPGIE